MKKTALILALLSIFSFMIFTSCRNDNPYNRVENLTTTSTIEKEKMIEDLQAEKNLVLSNIEKLEFEKANIEELLNSSMYDFTDEETENLNNRLKTVTNELKEAKNTLKELESQLEDINKTPEEKEAEKSTTSTKKGIEIQDKEPDDKKWGEFIPVP